MDLVGWLKKIFKIEKKEAPSLKNSIYEKKEELIEEIHSVWDYIKLNDNSQASHIAAILGFDEWITMDEILRRIRELFGMDYKNDRSLYPYIKTLVDIGLVETNNVGGKKKWRKRDILIKLEGKKEKIENEKETVKNS
ncbi:MAG: hypothetical protein CL944_02235 [Candidatus Diapherotrites archaeon]|uniref:Uncharacterized protein n=1 Tax=Candidatus Iainarchaeum sp. TaxID=3101447 RepID=A0A2D6LQ06_9ARCH|nr:hypothetical protein [Candidatus Diapherotrites archaeon]|tara:strand:- start:18280 stop:18693 length:414 start_codon:yes stop_codon:yes gene_type:complete